jgi:hypothetical protein
MAAGSYGFGGRLLIGQRLGGKKRWRDEGTFGRITSADSLLKDQTNHEHYFQDIGHPCADLFLEAHSPFHPLEHGKLFYDPDSAIPGLDVVGTLNSPLEK